MKNLKLPSLVLLVFIVMGFSSFAAAQETLVDLARAGNREAVLAAITSPDIDIDAEEADGSTVLHWATYLVDHEMVKALLEAGAEANITNDFGSSPLIEAVKLGDVELVSILLEGGANPDSPNLDKQTPLMLSATIGSLEIAELLIEHGANVNTIEEFRGQTALMWAAGQNYPAITELLISHGADVSVRAVHDDWPRQMTSEPRAQFRQIGGLTALLYATRSGCYRCAVAIVEAGADINKPNPDGVTPLLNALDNKGFDIAMYLLDQGAKANTWDRNGRTPLYVAVDMNSFVPRNFLGFSSGPLAKPSDQLDVTAMQVVNRLLEMGVDTNHQLTRMRPNGNSRGRFADYMLRGGTGPLMLATLSYDTEVMEALLAHGAEVDLLNVFQITPLMAAAGMSGSGRAPNSPTVDDLEGVIIKTIDVLLDAGADINARIFDSNTNTAKLDAYIQGRDHEGKTALFAAAETGWSRVVEHLLARGADPSIVDAVGDNALDAALAPIRTGPGQRPGQSSEGREATAALLSAALAE